MPTAGDEGYEKLVQCPYDRSHEIRKGRMQFHLEKCRKNFPTTTMVECPYNKSHVVRKEELEYHKDEDCPSRNNWDRFCHQIDTDKCPVQNLVPVNAATVPDGDENWDDFEATGSVLENIRAEAEKKPIFRHRQCVPKSVRKNFREEERQRHSAFVEAQRKLTDNGEVSATAPVLNQNPEPKPLRQPSYSVVKHVSVVKQDPSKAVAAINKQFKSVDLNSRSTFGVTAPSDTSSVANDSLSEFEVASTSRQQMPFSYAAASRAATSNRPPSAMTDYSSNSMMTALSSQQAPNISRPTSVMSNMTTNSYVTGPLDRPPSAMSNSSAANSTSSSTAFTYQRAPNSATFRQSTAMSIAASAAAYYQNIPAEEGFCQIPIPGLGRGRRRPDAKQPAKQFANK